TGGAAAAEGAGGGSGGSGGRGRIFSEAPLPLEALRALDGEVRLDVERLRASRMELEAVHTVVALKAGDLTVEPLAATLAGGSLGGRLALSGSQTEPV